MWLFVWSESLKKLETFCYHQFRGKLIYTFSRVVRDQCVYIKHLKTYSNVSTSAAWRNAWWSQWRMNINGASSSCIPCNTAKPWSHVSLIQHSKNTITSHQYIEQICSLWNFCKGNIFFFLNAFRISQIIEIDS